jgi:hypothetical protein
MSDEFTGFSGLKTVSSQRGDMILIRKVTLQNKITRTPLFMRYDMIKVASDIGDAFVVSLQSHSKNSFLPEGAPSWVIASTS